MINGLDNIVKGLYKNILSNAGTKFRNCIAVNQYNSIDVSEENVYEMLGIHETNQFSLKKLNIQYHQFDATDMCSAYEPFLDYISSGVKYLDIDMEKMFEVCKVLPIQKHMFKRFFENGIFIRNEILIYNEYEYEKTAFRNSIFLMIKYIAKKQPVIFIFNKLHIALDTTIEMIDLLITDGCKDISFLMSYDNSYSIDTYMQSKWIDLNNTLVKYDLIVEWQSNSPNKGNMGGLNSDLNKLPEYYKKIYNMKETMAFEQAYYYANVLHSIISKNKSKIDISLRYDFYGVFTIICVYANKIASAILFCNEIKQLRNDKECSEEMKIRVDFFYDYLLAYTQMYNDHEADANESAKRCIELAQKLGDERSIFCGELIEHMSRFSGWKNDVWLGAYNEKLDEKLIKRAEKFGYINHLAHILVYAFDNDSEKYNTVDGLEERIPYWKKGIDIAAGINNTKFVLEACKKAIMLASTSGYYDVSDYIYLNYSKPVVIKTNDSYEEANIYNGFGFNKCMESNYKTANEYFNKALDLFMRDGKYDYVAETIYNMSINCIKAGDYENGDIFITAVIKILEKLRTSMMRVCHLSKLCGLKAICTVMNGNLYTACNYANRAKQYLSAALNISIHDPYIKYWRDDIFLYNYAKICIELEMNNETEAEAYFKRALELTSGGGTYNNLLFECDNIHDFKVKYEAERKNVHNDKKLSLEKYSIDEILQATKNISLKIEYDAMKNDIEFIDTWKQLLSNLGNNPFLLVENAANSFKNNYNVTNFIVIQYSGEEPAILYSDSEIYLDRERLNGITKYFEDNPKELFASKFERGFDYYSDILSYFEGDIIASFFAVPFFKKGKLDIIIVTYSKIKNTWNRQENKIKIYENNLVFYSIVFRELVDSLDRINDKAKIENKASLEIANEELKKLASIDRLTKIYNRQGLYNKIDEYAERHINDICVAYIDLDNFKYYNDHFGHDVGDVVLKEVAHVFNSICGENDIAVRYGGDEFLILFNTDDCNFAVNKVKTIYDIFKQNNYYIDKIGSILLKPVDIPEEYRISASIGVAKVCGNNLKDDISIAITNADKTLYYIKRTTKRACRTWEDVKDII